MTTKNVLQKCFLKTPLEEQIPELILAPDGYLYLSPSFEDAADWSYVFYNGNICIRRNNNLYYIGGLPEKCVSMPTVVGKTICYDIADSGCLLHSQEPILNDGTSVFAVFRYKDLMAFYMADSMVSKAINFALMEHTPEEEAFYVDIFNRMVCRHSPEAEEKVRIWLNGYSTCGKEV